MVEAGYLLSSFPELEFDIESNVFDNFSIEQFVESCDIILPCSEAKEVHAAVFTPEESKLTISQDWTRYQGSIQNEIAKNRWQKLKTGVFPQEKGVGVSLEAVRLNSLIHQAENPLQAQLFIFKTYWGILEELEAQYQSSIENVIAYGWKLQKLQLLVQFKKALGSKTWNHLVDVETKKAGFSPTAITGGIIE